MLIATSELSTIAGQGAGYVDGIGTAAKFSYIDGITTDGVNLYVNDENLTNIRKIE